MRRIVAIALLFFLVASCGGGGGGGSAPPPGQPPGAGPTPSEQLAVDLAGLSLEVFYEESLAALTYRSPETIVWLALESVYPLDSAGLDNWSDGYQRETFAMYAVVLDALRGYDTTTLTPAEKLTYDFYEWYLQDAVDRLDFIYYDFVATYNFNGVQSNTQRFFTDIHPLAPLCRRRWSMTWRNFGSTALSRVT